MSYFGTDGIRGLFGKFPITPDFVLKLGYVTGQVYQAMLSKPLYKQDLTQQVLMCIWLALYQLQPLLI